MHLSADIQKYPTAQVSVVYPNASVEESRKQRGKGVDSLYYANFFLVSSREHGESIHIFKGLASCSPKLLLRSDENAPALRKVM